jgi:hypothetical protein
LHQLPHRSPFRFAGVKRQRRIASIAGLDEGRARA